MKETSLITGEMGAQSLNLIGKETVTICCTPNWTYYVDRWWWNPSAVEHGDRGQAVPPAGITECGGQQ